MFELKITNVIVNEVLYFRVDLKLVDLRCLRFGCKEPSGQFFKERNWGGGGGII